MLHHSETYADRTRGHALGIVFDAPLTTTAARPWWAPNLTIRQAAEWQADVAARQLAETQLAKCEAELFHAKRDIKDGLFLHFFAKLARLI